MSPLSTITWGGRKFGGSALNQLCRLVPRPFRIRCLFAAVKWWDRPDLNRDCRFRKPVLYPFKQRPLDSILPRG